MPNALFGTHVEDGLFCLIHSNMSVLRRCSGATGILLTIVTYVYLSYILILSQLLEVCLMLPVIIISSLCFWLSVVISILELFVGCFDRHADGKVCFWDMNLRAATDLMYSLNTASIFVTDTDEQETASAPADEDWPPFRKVPSSHNCGCLI